MKSHRPKRKSHRLSRKPSWYAAALPARPYPCPCLTPVLRCLAQRIFISMYQSSIKVSEVKEEAVQPSTTKNDYPSADDRTVDYRTTMLLTAARLNGCHQNLCWGRAYSGFAVRVLAMACVKARDCWRTLAVHLTITNKKSPESAT